MAKEKSAPDKVEPQKPKWATCSYKVGFRYVQRKEVEVRCEKKARSDGLCDIHGGTS
jgi:hypothetical protein